MRALTNAFVITYLVLQFTIPLRGFLYHPFETRGRFSWNMYAKKHEIRANYLKVTPDGRRVRLDYKNHFNYRPRATHVQHRDSLPLFHAYLCDVIHREDPGNELYGEVITRLNEGLEVELVSYGVELCTADNYGVNSP